MPLRAPAILLFISVLLFGVAALAATEFTGEVVGITDGDTLTVLRGEQLVRIRLHGIDAPEKTHPFGTVAHQYAGEFAFRQIVTVRIKDYDRYGRTVAEIILPDGRSLNEEMVRAGLAWWYRQYAPGEDRLRQLEAAARNACRGLWADATPVPPGEWRRSPRGPSTTRSRRSEPRSIARGRR